MEPLVRNNCFPFSNAEEDISAAPIRVILFRWFASHWTNESDSFTRVCMYVQGETLVLYCCQASAMKQGWLLVSTRRLSGHKNSTRKDARGQQKLQNHPHLNGGLLRFKGLTLAWIFWLVPYGASNRIERRMKRKWIRYRTINGGRYDFRWSSSLSSPSNCCQFCVKSSHVDTT